MGYMRPLDKIIGDRIPRMASSHHPSAGVPGEGQIAPWGGRKGTIERIKDGLPSYEDVLGGFEVHTEPRHRLVGG
jgi:hypothetical protein